MNKPQRLYGQAVVDNAWQKEMRDRILKPKFYEVYAKSFEFQDSVEQRENQFRGIDTLMVRKGESRTITIDEKIVRWPRDENGLPRPRPYDALVLETMSCTVPGHESDGWIRTHSEVDMLLYCCASLSLDSLDCHFIDFRALQKWFLPIEKSFSPFGPLKKTTNKAFGRVVRFDVIARAVPYERFRLELP